MKLKNHPYLDIKETITRERLEEYSNTKLTSAPSHFTFVQLLLHFFAPPSSSQFNIANSSSTLPLTNILYYVLTNGSSN